MLSIVRIVPDTSVDGPGLRTSVYCAGCPHHCPSCHNPQTWNISAGTWREPLEIWREILELSPDSNITFTGGDPLFQVEGFIELAKLIKSESSKTIWCYTGYTFEAILADEQLSKILPWLDVLVDGRFQVERRNPALQFRGSENQRLIDIKKSLATGTPVLWRSPFSSI